MKHPAESRIVLESLEPRLLLDGAVAASSVGAEAGPATPPAEVAQQPASTDVPLYGVFTGSATHGGNSYTQKQKFDYQTVELQVTYTAPSGRQISFFGYHAGDGQGGQDGNVWKFRALPDEVGTWTYSYTWTDGATGGSGSFDVVDTGLPGPLKIADDRSWFFDTARGDFHARPYDLHHYLTLIAPPGQSLNDNWTEIDDDYQSMIADQVDANYNLFMLDSPSQTGMERNYWYNDEKDRFDVEVWDRYESILLSALDHGVYTFAFDGMVGQGDKSYHTDRFMRYFTARYGAIASYVGWSPTWEFTEIWSNSYMDQKQGQVHSWNPWGTLLTAHDHSDSSFADWMGFSMRQLPSNDIFDGNTRTGGKHGGIESPLTDRPIIGSEDLWQDADRVWDQPGNETELRRGAWGVMMAGVIPLFSEWHKNADQPGNESGEPDYVRMLDFFYSQTQYRQYQMLNGLVSAGQGQIASGVADQEYLVYDQNGGTITIDLSGASSATVFDVLWFDADTGATQSAAPVTGGQSRSFSCPYGSDSVLLLRAQSASEPPAAPSALQATAGVGNVELAWTDNADNESLFVIERKTGSGGTWGPLASVIANQTQYTDATAQPETQYVYRVRATNGAGESAWSNEETVTTPEAPAVDVKINFQLSSNTPPAGYLPDDGSPYGARNGQSYGWSGNNTDAARDRDAHDDARYDTLVHFEEHTWEIELPNGTYEVKIVAGDPAYTDQVNSLDVEGTAANDPDGEDHFDTYELTVTVADGRLSIAPAAGASNAKIAFVEIVSAVEPDTTPPAVTATERNGGLDQPDRLDSLSVTFDEDVSASIDLTDLLLTNETTGQPVSVQGASVTYAGQTDTATWDLSALNLEPGIYTPTLSGAGVTDAAGNSLAGGDYSWGPLLVAPPGDADRSGTVDVGDLGILAGHWMTGPGATWAEGDFTGDGWVDVGDLGVLAGHWQTNVTPAPATPAAAPAGQGQAACADSAGAELPAPTHRLTAPAPPAEVATGSQAPAAPAVTGLRRLGAWAETNQADPVDLLAELAQPLALPIVN